jgi:hypothetical protein
MSAAAASGPLSDAGAAVATDVPGVTAASAWCDNCGAAVTGRYCTACGQRLEPPLHSLWHFIQAATEDLTHADSRLWRTLGALLFRPGYLTREFLAGRRARYLPPVRLYLVISVMFFLWASATHGARVVRVTQPDHGPPHTAVTPLDEETFGKRLPGESAEQHAERVCSSGVNYDGPWRARIQPAAHRACVRMVLDKGRSLTEVYLHNVPRAMFIFLPLLAGVMMLMYWRPRHYYVEHLLLLLHNHACVFVVLPIVWGLSALVPRAAGVLNIAVFLYLVWYMYRSMRTVYGQGKGLTIAKLAALSIFYFVFGMLMFLLNFAYSALTLE